MAIQNIAFWGEILTSKPINFFFPPGAPFSVMRQKRVEKSAFKGNPSDWVSLKKPFLSGQEGACAPPRWISPRRGAASGATPQRGFQRGPQAPLRRGKGVWGKLLRNSFPQRVLLVTFLARARKATPRREQSRILKKEKGAPGGAPLSFI